MITAVDPNHADFGKYRLLRKLAQGGMAEIFLANQMGIKGFEKLVVIKRVLPNLSASDDFINMFLDEARIAARLEHPNIVRIYDLGEVNGQYYIAMEYIAGEDLASVIQQCKRQKLWVPVEFGAEAAIGAAEALFFAHEMEDAQGKLMNLVHRDVSPSNILVTYQGSVKLVDFGIARAETNVAKTEGGQVKGKIQYLSPEQCRGNRVDGRTDIFALGIVLHELLTCKRLFQRDNQLSTMNAILGGQVEAPSTIRPDVPPELDAIVLKALQREPEDRYQTASELAADLSVFLMNRNWPRGTGSVDFLTRLFGEPRKKAKLRVSKGQKLDETGYQASTSVPLPSAPGAGGHRTATGELEAIRSDGVGPSPQVTPGGGRVVGLHTPKPPTSPSQIGMRPPTSPSQAGVRPPSSPSQVGARPPSSPSQVSGRPSAPGAPQTSAPRRPQTMSQLPRLSPGAPPPPSIAPLVPPGAEAPPGTEQPGAEPGTTPAGEGLPARRRPNNALKIGVAAALAMVGGVVGVAVMKSTAPIPPVEDKPTVGEPGPVGEVKVPSKAPPTNPTPPPGLQVGGVRFKGVPDGARVTVDGNVVGNPGADSFFSSGKHEVKVDAKGFLLWETRVDVSVGKVAVVDVQLVPRPVEARGTLEIACQPWCQITLDGRDTGKTSPARLSVSVGAHTLVLTNPPAGLAKKISVTVAENGLVKKAIKLDE